jgi:DNA-binding response OmpR family regulator
MANEKEKNGKTILVVDDESSLRKAMSDKLNFAGFSVLEAKDGVEGMEIALSKHPDLILLDILMPKMDGISMLKTLREDSWGKTVPVIILTNVSDYSQLEEALKLGISEYMVKAEWSLKDVVLRVDTVLRM